MCRTDESEAEGKTGHCLRQVEIVVWEEMASDFHGCGVSLGRL